MPLLSDYDYELPPDRIAQTPLADRAASRLMFLHRDTGQVEHRSFTEVPEILRPGDLLVMNDTRVSALRLYGHKESGGAVEALLLSEVGPGQYIALMKPGKRLKTGSRVKFAEELVAAVASQLDDGQKLLQFDPHTDLGSALREIGRVPLPPYITEALADPERYQTVVASHTGSAAAPTAGLHFTIEMIHALEEKGIGLATVTLDVGLDTFRPVSAENLDDHRMHGERCSVSKETAEKVANCQGRIVAVGTTAVRTLETFASGPRRLDTGTRVSTLFIRPGFNFQVVDGMFTNFHLPKTTMMIMLSALVNRDRLLSVYAEAVRHNYRFLSFGDSMLLL